MKKLVMTSILLILSNVAFAEVGPLTAATQKYFAETGQCYIKYYDYSQAKMMQSSMQSNPKMKGGLFGNPFKTKSKDGKLQPSAVFEFTKGENCEANKRDGIKPFKSKYAPGIWNIVKNEKFYMLNKRIETNSLSKETYLMPANNKGIRKDIKDCNDTDLAIVGLNALPVGLALTIPDVMMTLGNKKFLAKKYDYDSTTTVTVDGISYQCEQYSLKSIPTDKMSPFANTTDEKMIVKLFYKEGKLEKFEERSIQYDVEVSNTFNKDLTTVPKGYTIYADTRFNLDGLLQRDVILEKY